ncbi:MAG: hypothetical protein QOJ64_4571 [Acidobacteriota bacterium]|jgi:hypothetical protein|nr:hypothetical protein [Acidobacteriota bacterium]
MSRKEPDINLFRFFCFTDCDIEGLMKLVPCPDCHNRCSPTAVTCPKCGRVMQPGDLESKTSPPLTKKARATLFAIACFFVLAVGTCIVISSRPPECPIHKVAMTDTGRTEERPPLSGHLYRYYNCPQGHEWLVDECPSCTKQGDADFQQKELRKILEKD